MSRDFLVAADDGDIISVKRMVEEKIDVNGEGPNGNTALMYASDAGHVEVVQFLLEQKADLNQKNNRGVTAVHAAAREGRLECVQALVAAKADLQVVENVATGLTPLLAAVVGGHALVIQFLLKCDSAPDFMHQRTHIRGANAVFIAAMYGYVECMQLLIDEKADINQKNKSDQSPIEVAMENEKYAAAALLLMYGAEISDKCERSIITERTNVTKNILKWGKQAKYLLLVMEFIRKLSISALSDEEIINPVLHRIFHKHRWYENNSKPTPAVTALDAFYQQHKGQETELLDLAVTSSFTSS